MSRDAPTRRLISPSSAAESRSAAATASVALVSLLAQTNRLVDLLPTLHQQALDATGGDGSLLFEHNPRNGVLQATSGFALDALLSEPWAPSPAEAGIVSDTFRRGTPVLVADADRDMPDLASRLGARAALLLPLARGSDRIGMVAIGFTHGAPPTVGGAVAPVADAFVIAIETARLRRSDELQRDLRRLLEEFSASIAATMQLAAGLDIFCHGANRLFGADRTSVWIHDRRARQLVLRASTDPEHAVRGIQIPADDPLSPAAAAMRRARSEILPGAAAAEGAVTSTVTVPLRGCRRALGTVVFEGVRVEPGGELDLLDRADELGRQLSNAVENLQLLDDVIRSRRELEDTFDSIAHLIAVFDRGGRIVHVNNAFAARVGRPRDQLIEQPITDLVGPELAMWLAELARESATGGPHGPASREIVDSLLKGPFIVTVTDLLNPDRERIGSVIVARDLTPQTRLEAEREELRQRLTQSEKLAALGQFVAGIAHELNNPLQGVLGHLELMRVTGAFPKQLRREVQTIYREADRAAKIVRNLLVFAGSRRVERRPVSLNAVLQKVVAVRGPACRAAGIEVVRRYDEKLPRVQSDPLLLHQVFVNLVMNAEQAIASAGGAGRIEITTSVAPERQMLVASVRDTGCGITPEALPRIFEPFYTTKDVGQGTGLGLAIAYGIVQDHGGQITAANHPESGAVITVELPIASVPRPHVELDADR
jgi:two-component system, NtrC family, sensor kinase